MDSAIPAPPLGVPVWRSQPSRTRWLFRNRHPDGLIQEGLGCATSCNQERFPKDIHLTEDKELIAEIRRSPDAAVRRELLGGLFQRHRTKVVLWCYRFAGNPDLAADLAQDVFMKAFSNIDS